MDTRAGRRLSEAPEQRWIPSLAGLALELPIKMTRAVTILLHPESTQPGRDGIAIGPMNHDWVRRCSMNSDKRGDLP
jgi:hypothetical protein